MGTNSENISYETCESIEQRRCPQTLSNSNHMSARAQYLASLAKRRLADESDSEDQSSSCGSSSDGDSSDDELNTILGTLDRPDPAPLNGRRSSLSSLPRTNHMTKQAKHPVAVVAKAHFPFAKNSVLSKPRPLMSNYPAKNRNSRDIISSRTALAPPTVVLDLTRRTSCPSSLRRHAKIIHRRNHYTPEEKKGAAIIKASTTSSSSNPSNNDVNQETPRRKEAAHQHHKVRRTSYDTSIKQTSLVPPLAYFHCR